MFGFGTTYTFVSVAFELYGKSYAYRTDDKTIKVNDTVIVPVSGKEKAAVVTDIRKYKKNEVPFPLDKTKFVIRKATKEDLAGKSSQDMRVPIDISAQSVGTNDGGYKVIVLDQKQRDELRKKLSGKTDMKIIETYPISMAGQVVKEGKRT